MSSLTNQEIIQRVNAWQSNPRIHPLTCKNNSNHALLEPKEEDGKVVLECPTCGYVQNWIPDVILRAYVSPQKRDK